METLFIGGKLFDGENEILDGQGVLVDAGRVVRTAPAGEFSGFAGSTVDTSGGTLMPGLIDCHVHLVGNGAPDLWRDLMGAPPGRIVMTIVDNCVKSLRGGVTAVRDCGGKDHLEFAVRDAINAGQLLGPTIYACGKMVCMTGGHGNPIGRIADGVEEVVKAVREQIHAGCDLVKIMATGGVLTPGVRPEDAHYSAEEMAAGISEGHRFRRRCASHAQGSTGILNAVRGGIDSIEHGIWLTEECISEMIERGTYLVPTLAAVHNILKHKDDGIPDYIVDKTERASESHHASISAFYKAGGKIAMGTDAGTPFNPHGENAYELQCMTEVGISNLDALIISTRNAADLVGLETQGRVAEGMEADFLIVDGDPAADISQVADLANHRAVFKGGVEVLGVNGGVQQIQRAAE